MVPRINQCKPRNIWFHVDSSVNPMKCIFGIPPEWLIRLGCIEGPSSNRAEYLSICRRYCAYRMFRTVLKHVSRNAFHGTGTVSIKTLVSVDKRRTQLRSQASFCPELATK